MRREIITAVCALGVALAFVACDDGGPAGPKGAGSSCEVVSGKGVSIEIDAADWVVTSSIDVHPITMDTTTTFYGSVTLSTPAQVPNVNPGDTVTVQAVFRDPLVVRSPVPPYVSVSVLHASGGFLTAASYFTLDQQGTWDLLTSSTGVSGATRGVISGYWLIVAAPAPVLNDKLYCFTSRFRVPTTLGGQPIGANQTIPVSSIAWIVEFDGNLLGTPSPVYAE
jgi:hypothetical protein